MSKMLAMFAHVSIAVSGLTLSCLPARPLWVQYPQDVTTFSIDDQFLLGEEGTWQRGG